MAGKARLMWKPTLSDPLGGSLQFDAVLSETYTQTATATEFPVEEGANVSDHVRKNLDTLHLEVEVSNAPIDGDNLINPMLPRGAVAPVVLDIPVHKRPLNSLSALISAGLGAISSLLFGKPDPPAAQVLQFFAPFDAGFETLEVLSLLLAEGRRVDIVSRDWYLEDMIITNVTEPRTRETGGNAQFSIDFKKIRIVQTQQTIAPVPTEVRGKGPVKAGAQGAKPVDTAKTKSILDSWLGDKVG